MHSHLTPQSTTQVWTNAPVNSCLLEESVSVFSDHAPLTLVVYSGAVPHPLANTWPAKFPPIAPPEQRAPCQFVGDEIHDLRNEDIPCYRHTKNRHPPGYVDPSQPSPPSSPPRSPNDSLDPTEQPPPQHQPLHDLMADYGLFVPGGFSAAFTPGDCFFDAIEWHLHLRPCGNLDGSSAADLRRAAVERIQRKRSDPTYEKFLLNKYCTCGKPGCNCVENHLERMEISFKSGTFPEDLCLQADDITTQALCEVLHVNVDTISTTQRHITSKLRCGAPDGHIYHLLHDERLQNYEPLLCGDTHVAHNMLHNFPTASNI